MDFSKVQSMPSATNIPNAISYITQLTGDKVTINGDKDFSVKNCSCSYNWEVINYRLQWSFWKKGLRELELRLALGIRKWQEMKDNWRSWKKDHKRWKKRYSKVVLIKWSWDDEPNTCRTKLESEITVDWANHWIKNSFIVAVYMDFGGERETLFIKYNERKKAKE